jgi:hypothetical protein
VGEQTGILGWSRDGVEIDLPQSMDEPSDVKIKRPAPKGRPFRVSGIAGEGQEPLLLPMLLHELYVLGHLFDLVVRVIDVDTAAGTFLRYWEDDPRAPGLELT